MFNNSFRLGGYRKTRAGHVFFCNAKYIIKYLHKAAEKELYCLNKTPELPSPS